MQVGEVRVAEDVDFNRLRTMCQCHDGWKMVFQKDSVEVWTKSNEVSDFNVMKVCGVFPDISAAVVFDVLNDPVYRKKWDFNMIEGYEICQLSPNNDISYYSMKVPKPLKNRDFVTQRSRLDLGKEYMIFNHSVNHISLPPKNNFVRGISYLTGYHILSTVDKNELPGCSVTYITQSDPRGKLPVWAVNKAAQMLAPKVMVHLHKACRGYVTWKSQNSPGLKPWLFPEQNILPRLNPDDIRPFEVPRVDEGLDERDAVESEVTATVEADDDDSSSSNDIKGCWMRSASASSSSSLKRLSGTQLTQTVNNCWSFQPDLSCPTSPTNAIQQLMPTVSSTDHSDIKSTVERADHAAVDIPTPVFVWDASSETSFIKIEPGYERSTSTVDVRMDDSQSRCGKESLWYGQPDSSPCTLITGRSTAVEVLKEEPECTRIFCSTLDANIRPSDVENFFSNAGKVESVELVLKDSCLTAFVEFATSDAVRRALDLHDIHCLGPQVVIGPSIKNTPSPDSGNINKKDMDRRPSVAGRQKCSTATGSRALAPRYKTPEMLQADNKPHKCNTCGRFFSFKSTLLAHIRTHSGEKPYLCPLCPLKFSTIRSMKRHVSNSCSAHQKKAGTRSVKKCGVCGRVCMRPDNMKRHMEKYHRCMLNCHVSLDKLD